MKRIRPKKSRYCSKTEEAARKLTRSDLVREIFGSFEGAGGNLKTVGERGNGVVSVRSQKHEKKKLEFRGKKWVESGGGCWH